MSGHTTITRTFPNASVDKDGKLEVLHVADSHAGNGEVTLCGVYIDYESFNGIVDNPPMCKICEARDH